jgi:hypothetical protein
VGFECSVMFVALIFYCLYNGLTLHEDLNVPLVKEAIKQRSTRYHNKIDGHVNELIQQLLHPHNEIRLKRTWPADLRER